MEKPTYSDLNNFFHSVCTFIQNNSADLGLKKQLSIIDIFAAYPLKLSFIYILLAIWFGILAVFSSGHPVYNVLYVVLVFTASAGFVISLKLYFLGFLILFLYSGALSVLFIFSLAIVKMKTILSFDYHFIRIKLLFLFLFGFLSIIFFLSFFIDRFFILDLGFLSVHTSPTYFFKNLYFIDTDLLVIGLVTFNFYFFNFLIMCFIILITCITAISIVVYKNFCLKQSPLPSKQISNKLSGLLLYKK